MSPIARGIGWLLALLAMVGVVLLSRFPSSDDDAARAWIRLSWRSPAAAAELCRPPTPEDLAGLPQHMRPSEVCESVSSPFRLTVFVDGSPRLDETVEPGGARGDRPLTVFFEEPLEPGTRRVSVRFVATDPTIESEPLSLEGSWTLEPGRVLLVTLAGTPPRLVGRTGNP